MSNQLVQVVDNIIAGEKQRFMAVCSDPSLQFDREAAFAMQVLQANSYTMGIAKENPDSLRAAIVNVAAIGISLNPAKKLAYLVPRDKKVCLDISYMGLLQIAQQSGSILWGQAIIVKENDTFTLNALDRLPTHVYNPFGTDRGEIIGVYVVVKAPSGDYITHTMPIAAVFDIRGRSAAWKAWISSKKSCPWVTDPEEMIKKTCIKQASKYWPRQDRLDNAIHYLNVDGDEGLDFTAPAQEAPPTVEQPKAKTASAPTEKPPIEGELVRETATPGTNTEPFKPMTDGMVKMIRVRLEASALTDTDLATKFGAGLDALDASRVNEVLDWARNPNV